VSLRLKSKSAGAPRAVVVGGGVAGLEALIGLRTLAGDRLELELVAPQPTFAYRPLSVAAAFGMAPSPTLEIERVTRSLQAACVIDALCAVDPRAKEIVLASGARHAYDVLVIACGARPTHSIPGAIAFGAPGEAERFDRLLREAEQGRISRIVFALSDHVGWPLSIYELALLTADRLAGSAADVELTLLTPEPAPLAAFGGRASGAVLEELEARDIHFAAGLHPVQLAWGLLRARPGNVRLRADAVVTVPALSGPDLRGLPADPQGFIPVDSHGLVRGTTDVYAAGDGIAFPFKHGSLATQQADAVAEAIAARVGAAVEPKPFRPVLRGSLLSGGQARYLESPLDGEGGNATVSSRPLWWPPEKIAGRYIAPYLSGQITGPPGCRPHDAVEPGAEPECETVLEEPLATA
jgi:sulfide:quinone oxidoreductase